MQSADLAMIKDIPGYQIIMKAVLKHQIQQLVEQLSETTGEESILLTASVSDGSLSHLGSESGKNFLDGHNEIKSQFLGFVLKRHHTKKSEKQFASSPGRKSATLPLMYEDETESTYTDASYYTELQQDAAPQPAITPTKAGSKKKRKTAKATKSPVEIKPRPRRSAAAMKSPLKSDIYVGENEDIEDLSEDEQEHSESGAEIETKTDQENNAVEYTEIVPVSDPVPVLPKVDTEDLLLAQQYSGDSAEFSGAHGEHLNMENISVKKEAGFEIETGGISDEEDPEWEPGTKKRRKSSGSRSVTSPVNVSRSQAEKHNYHKPVTEQATSKACRFCQKVFSCVVQLYIHESNHIIEKHHMCNTCEKSYLEKGNLVWHLKIHTGEKPYTCETCESNLRNDTGEKPYCCETCGKSFKEKVNLVSHLKIHTGEKPYTYETCESHLRNDTGEKPYCCKTCGKSFKEKGNLVSHLRIHTVEKPYTCETCEKSFVEKKSLVRHLKIHSGEKPYCCEACGKLFAVKRNLIRHLKIHTREKHFTCEACGKLFSDADNLREHRKIHTGLRFFSCETCGKVFIEKHKLVRHSKTHSGVRYSCETCGKSFSDKCNLAKHCRRVHARERKVKEKQCLGTGPTKTKTLPQVFKVSVAKQCP